MFADPLLLVLIKSVAYKKYYPQCDWYMHSSHRVWNVMTLLYGLPNSQLSSLQRVQNSAARLVTRCKRRDHITPILRQLHWLPVKQRIDFKILLMTYKAYHSLAPIYICELISSLSRSTNVTLRSTNQLQLLNSGPRVQTSSFGGRAFSGTSYQSTFAALLR